jgi:hypothetical protein
MTNSLSETIRTTVESLTAEAKPASEPAVASTHEWTPELCERIRESVEAINRSHMALMERSHR